jgi:hypothetical protein
LALVWVTGISGAGKSTVCALLKGLGQQAADADEDGYSHWADRSTGQPVAEPPDPVPAGWLDSFGWKIRRAKVEALAAGSHDRVAFLCGSAENEAEVRDRFDLIVCIVVDDGTLRERLATRTTNDFGKNPEELAAALYRNPRQYLRRPARGHQRGEVVGETGIRVRPALTEVLLRDFPQHRVDVLRPAVQDVHEEEPAPAGT